MKTESLVTQKSSTKLLPRVTHAFDSAKSPCGLRNHQQNLSCCRIINHQRNYFHGLSMDSTAQTAPPSLEIISEIINETASTGDEWIRQRKKPMWAMK
jgi:hypothetical protein